MEMTDNSPLEVGARVGPGVRAAGDSGFDAMGKPVPLERRSNALQALRQMAPGISTEEAMGLVERMSHAVERDDPYSALAEGRRLLDLTGAYRLLATLCT